MIQTEWIQDAGEPGIAGVDVEVTDANGVLQTVTTDANETG
ncbi:hypothetical protein [Nonlabens xylanidelens]|nr:hypothetical protein [Nonlabens xylanidelens]